MKQKYQHTTVTALIGNLLLVFALFTLTRLVFVWCNYDLYAGHFEKEGYFMQLLLAGLRFDCTAILYLNCWMILAFLLPLHWKELSRTYYKVLRVLFVICNFIGLGANLCDCAYFPFTGRRTTWNVLQEFGNEENFVSIISQEVLGYWYLVLAGIALGLLLWYGFNTPAVGKVEHKLYYYAKQCVALALAVVLTIGGMRGGFTDAVRPITISNASQYVDKAIDAGIVLNTPFSIMRTMGKKAFVEREYMPMAEAEKLYSPVHTPADTTVFKPMNVVVFIMESFGKQAMAKGYMPFLSDLGRKGMSFEYSYSTGRKSIDGMPSVLSSIPSFVEPFFLTPASMNDLSGIAGELTRKKGYYSAFFHGAENGSMGFQAFAKATGFTDYFGRTEYNADPRYHGDEDFDGTWAIWDEEFLQFYCDKMCEMREPFCTSVFSASSHHPCVMPDRYKETFPWPKEDPEVFALIQYADNALRLFFEKAEKQPWFENTIFVVTADHSTNCLEPEFLTDLGPYKVPIVIYAPGMPELSGIDSTHIISQPDIMPTVLGMMGYDEPYVAFGQDALHCQPEETFAIHYMPSSGWYEFLQDDWLLQYDGEKIVHAYRFKEDRQMQQDLKESYPVEYELRMKSLLQQYMYRMNKNELVIR